MSTNLSTLGLDHHEIIFKQLSNNDKLNWLMSHEFEMSRDMLLNFSLDVSSENADKFLNCPFLLNRPILNLSIYLKSDCRPEAVDQIFEELLTKFAKSVENVKFIGVDFNNKRWSSVNTLEKIKSIIFVKCTANPEATTLIDISLLSEISFEKSDEIMELYAKEIPPKKICVKNNEFGFNGFSHASLTSMIMKSPDNIHLQLIGIGTGSYFDYVSDDEWAEKMCLSKLDTLDTTLITHHWYVGLRTARTGFLKHQTNLKNLTIHNLPLDFDGGRVLEFICEMPNLDTFKYGNVLLIDNKEKMEIFDQIDFTEIQISSVYEIVKQFPSISALRFKIGNTDIASDSIESIIDPTTDRFNNIKKFTIIDDSGYRRTIGVFLGLFKNMKNIEELYLTTDDRNMCVLFGEFLPCMKKLKKLQWYHNIAHDEEIIKSCFEVIKYTTTLTDILVVKASLSLAKAIFTDNVNVNVYGLEN